MEAFITEDRLVRDLRRYQLAVRLLAHRARTQTICDLTGLTRHQLATLRQRWSVAPRSRHRGPSPTSPATFFRSPRARSEAACLAVLCHLFGCVAALRTSAAAASLDAGEQLSDAYDAYRACFAQSDVEFEQLVLLANCLASGDVVSLERCVNCGGAMLVDRLAAPRNLCTYCQRPVTAHGSAGESAVPVSDTAVQGTLL